MATWSTRPSPSRRASAGRRSAKTQRTDRAARNTRGERAALRGGARDWRPRRAASSSAPLKAVEAIEAASTLPFAEGCRRERELFFECVQGEQAKALIHVFFAERAAAKVPEVADAPRRRRSRRGDRRRDDGRRHCDGVRERRPRGRARRHGPGGDRQGHVERFGATTTTSVSRGRLTSRGGRRASGARSTRRSATRPCADADLVVEAVFENLELKKRVFHELDAIAARPSAVLATNTSTLDIDEIARDDLPAGRGRRAAFLQPGARDAARRNRPGRRLLAADARDGAGVRQASRQSSASSSATAAGSSATG